MNRSGGGSGSLGAGSSFRNIPLGAPPPEGLLMPPPAAPADATARISVHPASVGLPSGVVRDAHMADSSDVAAAGTQPVMYTDMAEIIKQKYLESRGAQPSASAAPPPPTQLRPPPMAGFDAALSLAGEPRGGDGGAAAVLSGLIASSSMAEQPGAPLGLPGGDAASEGLAAALGRPPVPRTPPKPCAPRPHSPCRRDASQGLPTLGSRALCTGSLPVPQACDRVPLAARRRRHLLAAAVTSRVHTCRRRDSLTGSGGVKKSPGKAGGKQSGIRSTSKYRGVTHHCRTGRFESHIWDSGKQVCRPHTSS